MSVSASSSVIRRVFLCEQKTVETWVLLGEEQRNGLLTPLPSPDLESLYNTILHTIAFGPGEGARMARSTLQELLGESRSLSDAIHGHAPKLIVASLQHGFGCDYRISGVDAIFLDRWLWGQWRDALNLAAQWPMLAGLQVVVVATILHELAHWCVSLAVGTIERPLADFCPAELQLYPGNIDKLKVRLAREIALKATPEKMRVPWQQGGRVEAGQYIEWQVFGGIIEWSVEDRQAVIIVGGDILNFVEEFSLLDTIPPSSSSTTMKGSDAPKFIPVCEGVCWNFNPVTLTEADIEYLRKVAAALTD
ncbi:hypothetical protein GGX14DRAFT_648342 [Mycena pura]|uniref:Uncharacterized protein n=1 Tax=Mycena pura TaxID=153505 RepID=A0AAD6YML2_9AGAR|nr:hypothetical protein GGX14DRAFT_648342 [Mycena pura]